MFFFFNDTATTEIYTLSLHDALPIYFISSEQSGHGLYFLWIVPGARRAARVIADSPGGKVACTHIYRAVLTHPNRSEEHTSELQSHSDLVCRLLLEKKKHCATAALTA